MIIVKYKGLNRPRITLLKHSLQLVTFEMSSINKMKSMGPSTYPWVTPLITFDLDEKRFSTTPH